MYNIYLCDKYSKYLNAYENRSLFDHPIRLEHIDISMAIFHSTMPY